MSKREHQFNDIIRKVRKDLFGKGPDSIKTKFVDNMAISTLVGNLTPVEKFIINSPDGFDQVHRARTKMIQEYYKTRIPDDMEVLMNSRLLNLFSDIDIEKDTAVSVFVFENQIER